MMTLEQRCKLATDCLPQAEYRTRLEALHAELLAGCKDAAKQVAAERERCAMKLQVTRADVSLAAGELSAQEWRTCAAVLRWMQTRIRAQRSRKAGANPCRTMKNPPLVPLALSLCEGLGLVPKRAACARTAR